MEQLSEAIGLKDVMQVRDFPTADEDPQFDPGQPEIFLHQVCT